MVDGPAAETRIMRPFYCYKRTSSELTQDLPYRALALISLHPFINSIIFQIIYLPLEYPRKPTKAYQEIESVNEQIEQRYYSIIIVVSFLLNVKRV